MLFSPSQISLAAPHARQPRLLCARQAGRAVIVGKLDEPRGRHIAAPGFKIIVRAVAATAPAFLVLAVRVRAEQHAARSQRHVQFPQHARQFLAWYMKQRGVGEHAIEMVIRQIELEKFLPPYFAAAVGACHGGETRGAFQTDCDVAELRKRLEIAPRPTAKIEYCERRLTLDVL